MEVSSPETAGAHYAAVEIGGTKLQLVVGTGGGQILERRRLTVNREAGAAGIRAQIEKEFPPLLRGRNTTAVGVGFGGPVDWRTGRICKSHQIEGWSEFDLAGWLASLVSLPVFIDNDANVAALGEAVRGAGAGCDLVFYVTLGSGVGGGMVARQTIYHGALPGEAEIGHVRLDRSGTIVEERCSGWAVDRIIRESIETHPGSLLAELARGKPGGEARFLPEALARGDTLARQILKETAANLAFALSHVTHLFHPECVVLGGGLSAVGEPLRLAVEQALPSFLMEAFAPEPEVRLAGLDEDSVPVGALVLARTRAADSGV
jgi:glucokinase